MYGALCYTNSYFAVSKRQKHSVFIVQQRSTGYAGDSYPDVLRRYPGDGRKRHAVSFGVLSFPLRPHRLNA
jgi:hypothetical protein